VLSITRGDALRACPWLSYLAPLALWHIAPLPLWHIAPLALWHIAPLPLWHIAPLPLWHLAFGALVRLFGQSRFIRKNNHRDETHSATLRRHH